MSVSFDSEDPRHLAALQKVLLKKAARARISLPDFFELVMKEENTGLPVRVSPHQRIGLDFMVDHPECVLIWPAGASKSMCVVAMTLWLLGRDPTTRGLILSKTQQQAIKLLKMIKSYIETSWELKLVFPKLRESRDDSWREDRLVIDRPRGIRDASISAIGIDGLIQGSRLNWGIVDDMLDRENTETPEQRAKVISFVNQGLRTRFDPVGYRLAINNTAWHPDDLVHWMKDPAKGGLPSIRMTITGDVYIEEGRKQRMAGLPPWDHDLLRPKFEHGDDYACRIVRPGIDDSNNDVPLFPERFFYFEWQLADGTILPPAKDMNEAVERARMDIENKRMDLVACPADFQRFYMGLARDDASAMCKREWFERAKELARAEGYTELVSEYNGTNATFTGVDLAIGVGEQHDETAFFTFEILPDRRRRILDVEIGRWDFATVVRKIVDKHRRYKSAVRVENNAAQDTFRQAALQIDSSIPVYGHMTGRAKAHPENGVPGGFAELANGAWLVPSDKSGRVHPAVQKWIDGCLYYAPTLHTADVVMAWWLAREQAAKWGLLGPAPKPEGMVAKVQVAYSPGERANGGIYGQPYTNGIHR